MLDRVTACETEADWLQARSMLRAYWTELGFSPQFQGFEEELAELEMRYGGESGRFVIVLHSGEAIACGAIRRLDARRCEAKRVFVLPAWRGCGVGKEVVRALIKEAVRQSYEEMMADTLAGMTEALGLYETLGFVRTGAYAEDPTPDAIYLALQLSKLEQRR